jgi:hypothetical protein
MRITLAFLIISLSLACQKIQEAFTDQEVVPAAEKSCGFLQNSFGQRVSWQGRLPIKFQFNRGVPTEYRARILSAAQQWNSHYGREMIKIIEPSDTSEKWSNDLKNIIYWIDQAEVFSNRFVQAKSLIRWSGADITDVDILINAFDWKFVQGELTQGTLDLESLMVHEFGHALGLVHQDTFESVMFQSLSLNTVRNSPQPRPDLESLKCEYN